MPGSAVQGADLQDAAEAALASSIFGKSGSVRVGCIRQGENKLSSNCLIFKVFQLPPPSLSSRADNKEAGLSAALGLV